MWSESASETSMSSSDIRSLRDNECRRERQWKLCLSFSLLLFLFVSVVGIIAWSISIELNTKQTLAPYARMAEHWQMQRPQGFASGREQQVAKKYIQYQREQNGQQAEPQAAARLLGPVGSRRRNLNSLQATSQLQKQQTTSNSADAIATETATTTTSTTTTTTTDADQPQKHDSHSSAGHSNHEEEKMADFDYVPAAQQANGAGELDNNSNNDNKLSLATSITTSKHNDVTETEPSGARQPMAQQVINEKTSTASPRLGTSTSNSNNESDGLDKDSSSAELSADDELGFEVIASAISRSLSAKSDAVKTSSSEPNQQEGDSGLNADEMANNYELSGRNSLKANTQTTKRQRSPGAQVAEVIDHLVKSRKRSELSMKGPQIVVVAPVDNSSMRARSLVLAVDEKEKKKTATEMPVVQDKRIVSSLKKGLMKTSQNERKLAAFKGNLGRKKPIGGRLLGAPTLPVGPNGQLVKFSERVDVIEDEQPFPVMFIHQRPSEQQEELVDFKNAAAAAVAAAAPILSMAIPDNDMVESQASPILRMAPLDPSASIHISHTQPDEPRLRTPRHGSAPSADLERHLAPVATISRSSQAEPQQQQHPNANNGKLYSASQVIQEHLLKAKQLHQHRLGASLSAANATTTEASVPEMRSMAPQTQRQQQKQFSPEVMQPAQHNRQQQMHEINQQPNMNQLPVFPDQEYNVPASMAESLIHDIQSQPANINLREALPANQHYQQQQQQQQFPVPMHSYNSNKQAIFSQTPSGQQVQVGHQEAPYHHPNNHLNNNHQLHPQSLHLDQHQYHQSQQRQLPLPSRPSAQTQRPPQQQQPSASISFPKDGGFMNPLARFALRQLLGSVRLQQPLSPERPERPQEPASAAMQQRAAGGYSVAGGGDHGDLKPEGSESYGRSMPYGHSEPGYGYGGGGYHEPAPSYHDHDKNTKGLTFHFGGGPIGGGTQLITSPMGMLKHIMLPLLPSPRVNLNGKVVFGVVLEKTAGFGEPKKKYKFWGR